MVRKRGEDEKFSRRAATKSISVSDQTDFFILVQECGPESLSTQAISKQIWHKSYIHLISLWGISPTSKISYISELATCLDCATKSPKRSYMFGKCVRFGQCLQKRGRDGRVSLQPTAQRLHRRRVFGTMVRTPSRRKHRKNRCA